MVSCPFFILHMYKHSFYSCLAFVMVFCVPSASRVLMLLSQLERLNEEPKLSDTDAIRQITGKILHILQTQGELMHKYTKQMHLQLSYREWDTIPAQ